MLPSTLDMETSTLDPRQKDRLEICYEYIEGVVLDEDIESHVQGATR